MVSRCSLSWGEAAGVAAQANAISDRAVELAHTDAHVWEEALTALRDAEAAADDDPRRSFALEKKLEAAAAAPLEIASLGADVAAAAALAAGGSAAAAYLVRVNLGVRASDPRLARALASEQAAHDVAGRLLESTR